MMRIHDDSSRTIQASHREARGRVDAARDAFPRLGAAFARTSLVVLPLIAPFFAGCADKSPPPPPPCDQACADGVALRALRETMKFAFNKTLQGKDAGVHDETATFIHGTAHVFGEVTSNAEQGATIIKLLTYEFSEATYIQKNDDPKANFAIVVSGTVKQDGTLAVQPSSTTSLTMHSDAIVLAGEIYDPPIPYPVPPIEAGTACSLDLNQNGNNVAGKLCGRNAGFSF